MDNQIKTAFGLEMGEARSAYSAGDLNRAIAHLERAQILGQRHFFKHWLTHWWMLKIGLENMDLREIFGQCMRLIAVIPGYVFGWVPKGNTGGANVSPLSPMPLPDDLEEILKDVSIKRDVLIRTSAWLVAGILIFTVL
jgi:hypothetical protein